MTFYPNAERASTSEGKGRSTVRLVLSRVRRRPTPRLRPHSTLAGPTLLHMQCEGVDVTTNSAAQSNGASPPQPIAVAYFTRKPVPIDQYLCRERSVRFFSFAAALALIAAAILLALD
jgi:hypothetical protein